MQERSLENLIVIGDRLLIRPKTDRDQTASGLYLPPGVQEKEEVREGYVIKAGPGYPNPVPTDAAQESRKEPEDKIKYVPLQAKEGDLAIFLQKGAHEIMFQEQKYFIVPQSAVLMLERTDW